MDFGIKLDVNIPNDTKISAHQIYNSQNVYIRIGDSLQNILHRINLPELDYSSTLDHNSILRLTLICFFQYAELLPDSLAANASLKRLDWRYALFMPVNHPGIRRKAICNFRQGLLSSSEALHEFDHFLDIISEIGLFQDWQAYSLNAREFLTVICQLNQIYSLQKAMNRGLSLISSLEPDWFITQVSPHWFTRYLSRSETFDSLTSPENFQDLAEYVGKDIYLFLSSLEKLNSSKLDTNPEFQLLNKIFHEHFFLVDEGIQWKTNDFSSCSCRAYTIKGGE